jgi:hypothetical protein
MIVLDINEFKTKSTSKDNKSEDFINEQISRTYSYNKRSNSSSKKDIKISQIEHIKYKTKKLFLNKSNMENDIELNNLIKFNKENEKEKETKYLFDENKMLKEDNIEKDLNEKNNMLIQMNNYMNSNMNYDNIYDNNFGIPMNNNYFVNNNINNFNNLNGNNNTSNIFNDILTTYKFPTLVGLNNIGVTCLMNSTL